MRMVNTRQKSLLRFMVFGCLLSAATMCGCSGKPKNVLSEGKMVDLMTDMQLAESYSDNEFMGSDRSEKREELAQSILAYHGVTQEQLDSSYKWYGRNLDDYAMLYEKVDKELQKRKAKLTNRSSGVDSEGEGVSLWPWADHGVISSVGNSDGWVVSLPGPDVKPGDRIEWTMHLNGMPNLTGMLGVEYANGMIENSMSTFMGREKIELSLQVDTAMTPVRLFATLRAREETRLPVFVDSIRLMSLPYDSTHFMRSHNNRKYYPARHFEKTVESTDSAGLSLNPTSVTGNEANPGSGSSERPEIHKPARPGRMVPGKPRPLHAPEAYQKAQ